MKYIQWLLTYSRKPYICVQPREWHQGGLVAKKDDSVTVPKLTISPTQPTKHTGGVHKIGQILQSAKYFKNPRIAAIKLSRISLWEVKPTPFIRSKGCSPIFHTHCPGCQLVRGFIFGHLWTARKKTNLPSNLSTSIIAPAVLPSFEAVIVLVNLSAPHFTNSRPPICLWGQMPITRNSRSHKTYNRNATNPMEKPQA